MSTRAIADASVEDGWAERSGARLRFEVGGRGAPMLLIPGLGLGARSWDAVAPALRRDYRVIVIEPRGSGGSPLGSQPFDGPQLAADVSTVLDAVGVAAADVVGVSMGGMIAQHAALETPERVRSLTLVATHARACEWTRRVFAVRRAVLDRLGMRAQIDLAMLFLASPGAMERILPFLDLLRDRYDEALPDAEAYGGQMAFCVAHDTTDRLDKIRCPTLVVAGAEDLLVPASASRRLAAGIEGARYLEIGEAAHLVTVEAAARLVGEIRRFVRGSTEIAHALEAHPR